MLTPENYTKGMLVDDESLGGVSPSVSPQGIPTFTAFLVKHETGTFEFSQEYSDLEDALKSLNELPRNWVFEAVSEGCGDLACGKSTCDNCGACPEPQ